MTAGQRNCHLAIEELLQRYSLDDVLFAVREHVAERVDEPSVTTIACRKLQRVRELLAARGRT